MKKFESLSIKNFKPRSYTELNGVLKTYRIFLRETPSCPPGSSTPCTPWLFFLLVFLSLCLLVSCTTSPKAEPQQKDSPPDFTILPSGADLYLWADIPQAQPVLDVITINGMSGKDAAQILDRTNMALAAFYPKAQPGEAPSRRFFLAGWGKYPNLRAGISMTFSRGWKKAKSSSGNRYWHNAASNLGVAMGPDLAFVSDGDPFDNGLYSEALKSDPAPVGFEEFRKPTVLAGWLTNPTASMNNILKTIKVPLTIPVEELFFGLVRSGEASGGASDSTAKFEPVIRIKTPTTSHAFAMAGLLSLARPLFMVGNRDGPSAIFGRLLTNLPVRDGQSLVFDVPPMDTEEIALLFRFFSVNLSEKDP